ncbi:MAG: acyl-CoA desaturase [Flavobacteriales bacterium]|nr:acyl-CoA desaturase [Flavobacteriales bacterium]
MAEVSKISFNRKDASQFFPEVKARVTEYFTKNNISMNANGSMYFKVVFILFFYALTYALLITTSFSPWIMFVVAGVHGFFTALIGLNIGHDAIHGAFSKNQRLNKIMGLGFNIIGASDYMWKITHNIVHHTYTNIPGHDEDIDQIPLLRLNPKQELWWIHKFQHLYAFLLYPLASFTWVFIKDYKKFFAEKIGERKNEHPKIEYFRLFFFKAMYYTIFLVIPLIFIDMAWWQILIGFFFAHLVEGLTISAVFQLAHVVEGPEFPEPDDMGNMENSWAIHQMKTTADFAPKNPLVDFFFGGLNFQIEHHLFPYICHVHYKHIAPIVKATAKEHGVPYYENKSFMSAIRSHIEELKVLGKPTVIEAKVATSKKVLSQVS